MNNFIVVGYYTKDTLYEECAKKLIKSLSKFHILYYVEGIDSLGSWLRNVSYKPTFLKRMMLKFPELNIVYVDCDAVFFQYPTLFETLDCDIAVHLFDRSLYMRNRKGFEVLSGTIFLRNNKRIFDVLKEWEGECQKNPQLWDQRSLEKVLNGNFYNLPPEYCKIIDTMKRIKNPVIVHYQMSRVVRRNKGKLRID